jgi:hypothetical protein
MAAGLCLAAILRDARIGGARASPRRAPQDEVGILGMTKPAFSYAEMRGSVIDDDQRRFFEIDQFFFLGDGLCFLGFHV